ncbi:hypothetical protein C8D91_0368 [Marinicella litoralis]|uniref:Lipoprotein n=2 Tax=Marinicella litoralis TaxID=644220 RepID=A0A4R6XUK1_9GAMM|nr:hypothetical protein C8D91_0368 [Marinicella litoralis]
MWLGVVFTLGLFGCGNKGELYLPEKTETVESAQTKSAAASSNQGLD